MTKRKRVICQRCSRPKPQACICAALPNQVTDLITLNKCRVLVLQHPNEAKRKNRSLPLIELCMAPTPSPLQPCQSASSKILESKGNENDSHKADDGGIGETDNCNDSPKNKLEVGNFDFNFQVIVTKRLGDQVAERHPHIMKLLHDPSNPVFLCYPSDDAISVKEAMEQVHVDKSSSTVDENSQINTTSTCRKPLENSHAKVTLIFLDATWKYAKEMDAKSIQNNSWPSHMMRIKLNPEKGDCDFVCGRDEDENGEGKDKSEGGHFNSFKPRRFDIRTPPSINHLSTAECIAHVLRIVEEYEYTNGEKEQMESSSSTSTSTTKDSMFDVLMRPLDLMVKQWHSFSDKKKKSEDRQEEVSNTIQLNSTHISSPSPTSRQTSN